MGAGAPVTAFDVVFNRETAGQAARYFADSAGVAAAIRADESEPAAAAERGAEGRRRAAEHFDWDDVAEAYAALCRGLVGPGRS
jgi:glycosyltransferase involved in cell wall biosynthesis